MRLSAAARRDVPHRSRWFLHTFALAGFAVAQPLYDLLGRFGPFLVAHASTAYDVVLLTVALAAVAPLAVTLPAVILARGSARGGWWLHLAGVGLLSTLLALQLVRRWSLLERFDLVLPLVLGAGAAVAYGRYPRLRAGLGWAAAAAVVFPLWFLWATPVRSLLLPARAAAPSLRLRQQPTVPVVVLVFDELPLFSLLDEREQIDAVRFPAIAALAADSVWYRYATTVAGSTPLAVPAILTGRYPAADGLLPVVADYPRNLFTLLGPHYPLHVEEAGTRLCPLGLQAAGRAQPAARRLPELALDTAALYLHLVTPRSLGHRLPKITTGWRGFWQRDRAATREPRYRWHHPGETVDEFVAALERYPAASVHYLHVLLPHAPWYTLPDGRQYDPWGAPGLVDHSWADDRWQVAQGLQRHLLQVGVIDRAVGRLRAELERLGLYDQSLIVFTADHGASFRAGESLRWAERGSANLPDVARVPLLVKFPGGERRGIDDRDATTLDILPTVLATLGATGETLAVDGQSLTTAPVSRRRLFYPGRPGRAGHLHPIELAGGALPGSQQMLRFKIEQLGSGSWQRLFALGAGAGLIGAGGDSPLLQPVAQRLTIDYPKRYTAIDLSAKKLPLWISGRLEDSSGPRWIAVLINGRVAAVTRTYGGAAEERFAALVAPDSLSPGANAITVQSLADQRPAFNRAG